MGQDDYNVKSKDNINEEFATSSSIVSLVEFRRYVQEMEQTCRDWLSGELSEESFLYLRDSGFPQKLIIQEISSSDDDFDWSTIPKDVMDACDAAHSQYSNAWRLVHAVNATIEKLQSDQAGLDDPIARISILGKYLQQLDFSYDLLSKFQNPSLAIESATVPGPKI